MHGTALCFVVCCLHSVQAVLVSQNPPPDFAGCIFPAIRGAAPYARTSFSSHHALNKKALRWCVGPFLKMERVMRFELTTFSLATRCSTTELHPHRVCCFAPDARSGRAICLHSDGLLTSDFS